MISKIKTRICTIITKIQITSLWEIYRLSKKEIYYNQKVLFHNTINKYNKKSFMNGKIFSDNCLTKIKMETAR